MRRLILPGIMSLLVLSIVLPASASLVGTSGLYPWDLAPTQTPTPTPTPTPGPGPSPVPVAEVGNSLSNPVVITSNNAIDPVTAAAINKKVSDLTWTPVLGSDLSPFQDVKSLGGASVAVQPIDQILGSILGTIPIGSMISGDMGWSF
jgi:hypothetical protein